MKEIHRSNGQVGFEVEVKSKKGTKEYSNEIFGKMKNLMTEITKDLYEKPYTTLEICGTNGWVNPFAIYEIRHLSPRYCTRTKIKAFKTIEEAEEFKKRKEAEK